MKKTWKTLKLIGNVLVWLFVAFSVGVTILVFTAQANADGVPAIGGKCAINILTDSMEPVIHTGDLIIGKQLSDTEKRELQKDNIISFYADLNGDGTKEINTHKIIDINYDDNGRAVSYVTQGENNPGKDTLPVTYNNVICLYTGTRFGGLGTFLSFLQTSTGFLVVIVLPLIAFFIFELVKFILVLISVKGKGKTQLSAAEEELIKKQAIEEYLRQQQATAQDNEAVAEQDNEDEAAEDTVN